MINGYLDFFGDSIEKEWEISCTDATFKNADIIELTFNEGVCSESQLTFGASESSGMILRTTGLGGSLVGKWLNVTVKANGTVYQKGKYKVLTDVPNGQRTERTITAYDALHDIITADVAEWYNTLFPTDSSTTTIGALRHSFMQHFGITENEVTLVNDHITVGKNLATNVFSGRDAIRDICEANGCFGHIDPNGNFSYIFLPKRQQALYPEEDRYPGQALYPNGGFNDFINIDKQYVVAGGTDSTYMCEPITRLNVRSTPDDIGVTVGDGDNTYIIEGNFLLMGKSQAELETIATNILGVISDITYRPCNYTLVGNPLLEVGDGITIRTGKTTVYTILLQRTLKGVQSLKDDISAAGLEKQIENVNSVESQIKQVRGKTNELTRTIDETRSALSDLDEEVASEFLQTAQAISAKVGKTGGTQSFSWELTDSSWVVKSGDTVLFSVDANNVKISMKNQNVKIDDTGIDFSANASIKWNNLDCIYIGGGILNFGHPNFSNVILGSKVYVGAGWNGIYTQDFTVYSRDGLYVTNGYGSGSSGIRITHQAVGSITMTSGSCKFNATSLGFFSKTPISQPTISSESGSSVSVSKFNQVVAALHNLGLCRDTSAN